MSDPPSGMVKALLAESMEKMLFENAMSVMVPVPSPMLENSMV